MTILDFNMKSHRNTIYLMNKWMFHGCHQKDNPNLILLKKHQLLQNKLRKVIRSLRKKSRDWKVKLRILIKLPLNLEIDNLFLSIDYLNPY